MDITYSAREVFKIAVKMEENGQRFYSEAASAAPARGPAKLFKRLAADEQRHRDAFEAMAARVPADPAGSAYGAEADLYLAALSEAVLFGSSGRSAGRDAQDVRGALEVAIRSEKDAIFYYSEILRFVPASEKPLVEKIIGEERGHLSALFARYQG